MTGQQTQNAWHDESISDRVQLLVLMAICDEAGEDGKARPRIQDIAIKARCKERAAQTAIKELAKKGKIKAKKRKGTSTEYDVSIYGGRGAGNAPPQEMRPAGNAVPTVTKCTPSNVLSIKDNNSLKSTDNNRVSGKPPETMTKPVSAKRRKYYEPFNIQFAPEIARLCSLSIKNGARSVCFDAADAMRKGESPPKSPEELHPYFAKGGKIYREWPWRDGGQLRPMDIVKHWPRLSGAVKPPEVKPIKRVYAEEA